MRGSTIGIRGKIVLACALIAVLGVASVAFWLTWVAADGLTATAKQNMATAAHQEAEHVNAEFARAITAARALARTTLALRESKATDRTAFESILKYEIDPEKQWFGIWGTFEPEAFDGKDADFSGDKATPTSVKSNGRYVPYVYRGDGDSLVYDKSYDFDTSTNPLTYYEEPMKSQKLYVTNPAGWNFGTEAAPNWVWLVSFCMPVVEDGKSLGVTGVDFKTDQLLAYFNELRPMGEGRAALIDAAGNWATNPNKDLVGKPVEDAFYKNHKDSALKGEVKIGDEASNLLEGDSFSVLVPVHFEDSPNVWTLLVTVPRGVIMGRVDSMIYWAVGIGVGVLLVCLLIAWGVGSSTARPVRRLAAVMKDLASGKLNVEIPAITRRDEIGEMARTVETFKQSLV
jgi:methyl-accepting chemotaxis protein